MSNAYNAHAADLINGTIDLIEKVLIKHSAAVLNEMHDQIVARNEEIKQLQIALRIKTEEHNCCAEELMLVRGERDKFRDEADELDRRIGRCGCRPTT